MSFDTILFDLDDTLLDRNRAVCTFIELFKIKYAHVLDYKRTSKLKEIFIELDCNGYMPREEMFKEFLSRTSWRLKPETKEIVDFWNIEFPKCAEPVTSLYSILDYIQNNNIKMGIVTNSYTNFQYAKIDKLNIRNYMSTIIISEEVGISKPNPEIYTLALSRINSIPDTALFVGDYPSTDIKGAYDAGIASAWLSYGKIWDIKDYKPNYIINDLSELINIEL